MRRFLSTHPIARFAVAGALVGALAIGGFAVTAQSAHAAADCQTALHWAGFNSGTAVSQGYTVTVSTQTQYDAYGNQCGQLIRGRIVISNPGTGPRPGGPYTVDVNPGQPKSGTAPTIPQGQSFSDYTATYTLPPDADVCGWTTGHFTPSGGHEIDPPPTGKPSCAS